MKLIALFTFVIALLHTTLCSAEEARIAVAANFYKPILVLVAEFEKSSPNKITLSAGSTGALYAQIKNGAPFDIFLAADQRRPQALANENLAQALSQFTYAQGQLALWSANSNALNDSQPPLEVAAKGKVAIANPKTAPYGAAAIEVLKAQGVYQKLQSKLIQGKSISQTYQYVSSENIPVGFVALSQVFKDGKLTSGSAWMVPPTLHKPINQDVILLKQGLDNKAALAFMAYLRSEPALKIIRSFGYQATNLNDDEH